MDLQFLPIHVRQEIYLRPISVDPGTFEPMRYGMKITPLRAYAHQVPRYYIQNFGSAISHPDTNEYAAFVQDTIRLTQRLALNLGIRYDLQTFSTRGFATNPLWAASGKIPFNDFNLAPRAGLAYSIFPDYPSPLVSCPLNASFCPPPPSVTSRLGTELSPPSLLALQPRA